MGEMMYLRKIWLLHFLMVSFLFGLTSAQADHDDEIMDKIKIITAPEVKKALKEKSALVAHTLSQIEYGG